MQRLINANNIANSADLLFPLDLLRKKINYTKAEYFDDYYE